MSSNTPTAAQLFAQLINLRNEAGEKHYQRVKLAAELLKDEAWVTSTDGGGGDVGKAIDRLESLCFADITGLVSLCSLLDLYHHIPDIKVWRKANFNLAKLWSDWKAQNTPSRKTTHTPKPLRNLTAPNQFPELTPADARDEYGRAFKRLETSQEKIQRLEDEVARLKTENDALKEELRAIKQGAKNLFKIA